MTNLVLNRLGLLLSIIAAASIAMAQSEPATKPKIHSVSKITTGQHQTITITGTGFGTHAPYTGDSDFIAFDDGTRHWQAGYTKFNDTVTLIVESWANTKIVLGGFSGAWGTHDYTLSVGDKIEIQVWNAETGAGPANKKTTVSAAPTTITLRSSVNPSAYGDRVTFTAVVDSDAGVLPDGETVRFMDGATVLGTATLRDGSARFTTSTMESGSHSITAVYAGDGDFAPSVSTDGELTPLTQTVN
jgi:hypothetical protein